MDGYNHRWLTAALFLLLAAVAGAAPVLMHDPAPPGATILYQTHFGWVVVDQPSGGGGSPAGHEKAELRYVGYQSNRFLPFFTPNAHKRNAHEWHIWNTGQPMHLLADSNNQVVATVPAIAGMDMGWLEAWRYQWSTPQFKVGLIDTGVNQHRDFQTLVAGVTCTSNGLVSHVQSDSSGHGTFQAGLISAWAPLTHTGPAITSPTNLSMLGVAPFAKIYSAKCDLSWISLAVGIDWAVTSGCKVLNMAWGWGFLPDGMEDCIRWCETNGVICVQSMSNTEATNMDVARDYPFSLVQHYGLKNVMGVTALRPNGTLSAAFGSQLIAAPGFSLVSIGRFNTNYVYGNGTSFAAPLVCGLAAALWTQNPSWTYLQVINRIYATLSHIPGTRGRVNAGLALRRSNPSVKPAFQPLAMGGGGLSAPEGAPVGVESSTDLQEWTPFGVLLGGETLHFDTFKEEQQFFRIKTQ